MTLCCISLSFAQKTPVKIYHRTCPTLSSTSPSWYKLEAISEATGMPVGEFDEPFVRWEAVSCHESKVSFFTAVLYLYYTPSQILDSHQHVLPTSHFQGISCVHIFSCIRDVLGTAVYIVSMCLMGWRLLLSLKLHSNIPVYLFKLCMCVEEVDVLI